MSQKDDDAQDIHDIVQFAARLRAMSDADFVAEVRRIRAINPPPRWMNLVMWELGIREEVNLRLLLRRLD